jgi:hypothetical protein
MLVFVLNGVSSKFKSKSKRQYPAGCGGCQYVKHKGEFM